MKVKELIKLLETEGWEQVRTKGSHRQFRHSLKQATITVAGNPNIDKWVVVINGKEGREKI